MRFDHLWVVGFGGPESPQEVRPFLERVARGTHIPEARLKQVEAQYAQIGGFSPYNEHARRLLEKLSRRLESDGVRLPVFLALKNAAPFPPETAEKARRNGLRRGLVLVLAPHRSPASFGKYQTAVEEAWGSSEGLDYVPAWHDQSGFIQAQADQIREVWPEAGPGDPTTRMVFMAHSIPLEMARACGYEQEIRTSGQGVCRRLGIGGRLWIAYQSRSGDPAQPWLGPELNTMLLEWKREGVRCVVLVPIGFLLDHAEVLFDLDVQARQQVEAQGLIYRRASTVMDHPKFIEMLATLIRKELS